jgi:hypothetical protein
MVNNLIVGLPSSSHVADGASAAVLHEQHDIITNAPGFYDQAARSYYLTAASPAVNAGIDPGSANGFALTPRYEFQLPRLGCRASGLRRARRGRIRVHAQSGSPSGADRRLHVQFAGHIQYPGNAHLVVDRRVLLHGQRRLVGLEARLRQLHFARAHLKQIVLDFLHGCRRYRIEINAGLCQ